MPELYTRDEKKTNTESGHFSGANFNIKWC